MERMNLIRNKVAALRLFDPTVSSVLFEINAYNCGTVACLGGRMSVLAMSKRYVI